MYRLAQRDFWHESQLQDDAVAESSESELLLDDDASLELSDVNIVGFVKSTNSATLANSGFSTYIIITSPDLNNPASDELCVSADYKHSLSLPTIFIDGNCKET